VIVPDANLLLYAYDNTSTHHSAAQKWVNRTFSGTELIGLPWQVVWAFLRISTNKQIYASPLSMGTAVEIAQHWIGLRIVRLLAPGERHWELLRRMLIEGGIRGARVTDAELAAITIEYGGVLHTVDRGFARFPGLRWVDPLAAS
jgi:uncharacterized protein